MKRELWGGEFWTDGYYVATVGERANWGTVENYIQSQGRMREEFKQIRRFFNSTLCKIKKLRSRFLTYTAIFV